MPNLPHHLVAVDAICPACWSAHRVRGTVHAIVAEDGTELYRRCACGAIAPADVAQQQDLFATEAPA